MPEQKQIYKCEVCGNIVEVLHGGDGALICCGQPMQVLEEKTEDPEKGEKHVPIIEKTDNGFKVKIGSIEHPMTPDHHIEWIEIIAEGKVYRKRLNHEDKPEAEFCIQAEDIVAREYCNLHGLWKS